ncbi:MAG: peptide chain release factor 2 [Candidatus Sumerlaeia bacterium]|nr:peptide chain release factor 2 [Candidatus Sumerlaeia bacterium]
MRVLSETVALLDQVVAACARSREYLNADATKSEIEALEAQSQAPDFWEDQKRAQDMMRRINELKATIEPWMALEREAADGLELAAMLREEGLAEGSDADELGENADALKARLEQLELRSMLNEPSDQLPAFLQIHAGAGGTESQDWAQMLLRMYTRWCERKGYKVEMLDLEEGDTAGIKDATLRIEGPLAFGYLKAESGVHRLVRISPYDANARRHTSFASVDVTPEIDDSIEVDIGVKDKDWRIDSFRSSGKGGQKVNKTTSAVRIVHFASNVVVSCQNERSWHQNRDLAFQILRSRLYQLELDKRKKEAMAREDQKMDIDFGSQIRSYVLHPYQMVNDHRLELKTSDAEGVLEGEIDAFIDGYLRHQLAQRTLAQKK